MTRKLPPRFWFLAVPAGVALMGSIMVPLALAQSRFAGTTRRIVAQEDFAARCFLATQPSHPLELNTETLGSRFKSVAMEKEAFTCNGGNQTVDVETFIEVVERVVDDDDDHNGDRVSVESRRVETATCVKDFDLGYVQCNSGTPPLIDVQSDTPLPPDCSPSSTQPQDPVVMTTDETGGLIRTVKVEKEVLKGCNPGGATNTGDADLYVFTEIIEAKRGNSIRPVQRRFDAFICVKNAAEARIVVCARFTPVTEPPQPPP